MQLTSMLGRGLESLIPSQKKEIPVEQEAEIEVRKKEVQPPESQPDAAFEFRTNLVSALQKDEAEAGPAKEKFRKASASREAVFQIEIDKIKPNPHQPRKDFNEESLKELAGSIREFGIIQPLIVTKKVAETESGAKVEYELIAGERRLKAAKMVGMERVPAIIREVGIDKERLEIAIVENLQRADLNPLEAARAFAKLQDDFRITQREIAARVGKSREVVANSIRLLSLPSNIQEALGQGKINESQARLLLTVEDIPRQQAIFNDILSKNLTVRELRQKVKGGKEEADPQFKFLAARLEETLGSPVKILSRSSSKGKIAIEFYSKEELEKIIQKIIREG